MDRRKGQLPLENAWCADSFKCDSASLSVEGWALGTGDFFLNGENVTSRVVFSSREDIDALFGVAAGGRDRGFFLQIPLEEFTQEEVELSYGGALPSSKLGSYFIPINSGPRYPWPDSGRRFRVHGSHALEPFVLEGLSAARKIEDAFNNHTGLNPAEATVLDWGCGCGRVARWLMDRFASLSGVDIDADNVMWCQENLAGSGRWLPTGLEPPLPFEENTFDGLFGISIFTHIAEASQGLWLSEIMRVLKPGGYALVTVHGESSAARFNLGDEALEQWRSSGFWDLGPSRDLEAIFGQSDHYRGSLHKSEYVRDTWSKYADVVEILPATIGNHQDLVILAKR